MNDPHTSAGNGFRNLLRASSDDLPHPNQGGPDGADAGNDPLPKILQRLLGASMTMEGGQGGQGGNGNQRGFPPGLDAMLGAAGAAGAAGPEQGGQRLGRDKTQSSNRSGYAWNIAHASFALALGVCMVSMTAFNGAQFLRRDEGTATKNEVGIRFFWAFATAQLVLQSTRYFLERDRTPVTDEGWMNIIAGILPEPWRGRALLLSRYSVIYGTVVQDAMVVVFVLGCVAWWQGAVA